jgi:flap endonuclease-1
VDIGILIGTDYHPGIHNIGPKTALKLIKKHKNIETVIKKEKKKYNFTNLKLCTINRIRELFLLPEIIEGKYLQNLIWTYPNTQKIIRFLCHYHFLNEERVQSNLGKLVENYEKAIKYAEKMKDTPRTIQLTLDNLI